MTQDYVVRNVSEIWKGLATNSGKPIKLGWAMGPFFPVDELGFTKDFEVKEWNADLVNREWSDHAGNGPEYISVIRGRLTLICGQRTTELGSYAETERVAISAGQSVVLRPGVWRRFECTPDATGLSVRRPQS